MARFQKSVAVVIYRVTMKHCPVAHASRKVVIRWHNQTLWSRTIAIKEGGPTLPKSRRVVIKGAKQSTWKRHPESALPKGEVEDDRLQKKSYIGLPKSRRVVIKRAKQSTWERHPESALPKGEVEDDRLQKKKGDIVFKGFKHCLRYHPELILDLPMPMSGCLL